MVVPMPAMRVPMRPMPVRMRNRRGTGGGIKLHINTAIMAATGPMPMMPDGRLAGFTTRIAALVAASIRSR